ncbi:hypothetical protein JTE90_012909 [Oedothorax gibbosus]|uniref:Uncharacterized protein n=1 Tax=Oedothorax gibbosus TaxID=931172 RepID=A0AAV6UG04_9ARAC|nr:hypothetical protein JTE90_012909 [Oedothorax gibbosus]
MPETQQGGSIFRDLLLPRDPNSDQDIKKLGTFRLRYAFAEDGCRNSQVVLAKLLLDNISNTSEEKSFNAQLAVYWLLQAAKKGHNEAFDLLKDCLHFDIGTRLISKADIENCLNFSQEERIAREVTYSLFREIMSDTEDVITETVLRENVDLVFKQNKRKLSPTPQDNESSLWNRPTSKKNDSPPLTKTNESQGSLKKSPVPLSLSPKKSDDSDDSDKTSSTSFLLKNPVIDSMANEEILQSQAHVSFNEVMSSVQSCLEGVKEEM